MKRSLIMSLVFLNIICGVVTVILSNNSIIANSELTKNEAGLIELNAEKEELSSSYLQLVLNNLKSKARAEGFVTVTQPNYLQQTTVVGFLR